MNGRYRGHVWTSFGQAILFGGCIGQDVDVWWMCSIKRGHSVDAVDIVVGDWIHLDRSCRHRARSRQRFDEMDVVDALWTVFGDHKPSPFPIRALGHMDTGFRQG